MCRLLGFVSATPTTLVQLLGEEDLNDFTELSCKHADGWGLAWAADGQADGAQVTVVKARTRPGRALRGLPVRSGSRSR